MKVKRGAIKILREYLNEKFKNSPNWKHNQYHQVKRGYGDYLYFQDRGMFNAILEEILEGSRPEDHEIKKQLEG